MGALGFYAKYESPESLFGERLCLTKVISEWEFGFCIDTYIIDSAGIYFEDAEWNGKKLDYSQLGKSIKRKKFDNITKFISDCRSELDFLGSCGDMVHDPDIRSGKFYYVFAEYKEEDVVEAHSSYFYYILSIENDIVTYKYHSITDYHLCINERIYRTSIENFLSFPDDARWYPISGDIYLAAAKKIIHLIDRIFNTFK